MSFRLTNGPATSCHLTDILFWWRIADILLALYRRFFRLHYNVWKSFEAYQNCTDLPTKSKLEVQANKMFISERKNRIIRVRIFRSKNSSGGSKIAAVKNFARPPSFEPCRGGLAWPIIFEDLLENMQFCGAASAINHERLPVRLVKSPTEVIRGKEKTPNFAHNLSAFRLKSAHRQSCWYKRPLLAHHGTHFTGAILQDILKLLDIKHLLTSSYHSACSVPLSAL